MHPIIHDKTTNVLGAPVDWNEAERGPCGGLPVEYIPDTSEFVSWWQPTEDERALIAAGHPVVLTVVARAHPPVHLGVVK